MLFRSEANPSISGFNYIERRSSSCLDELGAALTFSGTLTSTIDPEFRLAAVSAKRPTYPNDKSNYISERTYHPGKQENRSAVRKCSLFCKSSI